MTSKGKKRATQIDFIIGQNLKKFRKNAKISRKELGRILGVSYQQVAKYEEGINKISVAQLLVISTAFGVSIQKFFEHITLNDLNAYCEGRLLILNLDSSFILSSK